MSENRGEKRTPKENKNTAGIGSGLEAFALISQLGMTLALPIVLGAVAGNWLDERLGTGMIFFLILLFLGIAGGLAGAYRLIADVGKRKK